jgi:hypothetical protein
MGSLKSQSIGDSSDENGGPLMRPESRYFVSSPMVEKVFDRVTLDYKLEFKKLKGTVKKHNQHIIRI